MLLTENEAKKRWCPHVRFTMHSDAFPYNNRPEHGVESCCLGPECAAWRWVGGRGYCGLAGKPEK